MCARAQRKHERKEKEEEVCVCAQRKHQRKEKEEEEETLDYLEEAQANTPSSIKQNLKWEKK